MEWRPYNACCHRAALQTDVTFCPECGSTLLRCMAFSQCYSLVAPMQACPVCIAPELAIDRGAITQSKVGGSLSIPLLLRNASKVERAIWIAAMVKQEGRALEPLSLPWEHIEPQSERSFSLDTATFQQGGTHSVGIIATLASRFKGREERYAFAGRIPIVVEGHDQQIVQNINLAGAQFATGGMIHAPVNSRNDGGGAAAPLRERTIIPFERAERFELEQNVRGYQDTGIRVPRDVRFWFTGFPASDRPDDGATVKSGGVLSCGRNGRRFDEQANPAPSDLSLRIYDPQTGRLDEDSTRSISRHHFDLLVLNDRLCIHARSNNGLIHNDRRLANGEVSVLRDGDRIAPLVGRPDALALTIGMRASFGTAERIEITREPRIRAA